MSTLSPQTPKPPVASSPASTTLPLAVIATAQLMVVLDDTIANIALPTLQNELGMSAASLPWVINAYVLAFGGLLLFGGRLGDIYGRRRMLQAGMAIFTIAFARLRKRRKAGLSLLADQTAEKGRTSPRIGR